MVPTVWQRLTLSQTPLARWRGASVLHWPVGAARAWRQGSWLLRWAQPLGALLVGLVVALGPFVPTSLIGVLLIACGGYWGLLTLTDDEPAQLTPIHLLVLAYWGVAAIAVAFSPVPEAALKGWATLTLYLLFFALAARILRAPHWRNRMIALVLHVSLAVSAYGIRQQFFGVDPRATWTDPDSTLAGTTRVYSFLGNPNLLASYLLPALALSLAAVWAWQRWLPKALAATMTVANASCLYLTDSRGGWIGMLALVAVFLLLLRYWWNAALSPFWRRWLLPAATGALAALVLGAVATVEPLRTRVASIFAWRENSSNNFRINVWAAVLEMIRDRPLIGIGPGHESFNQIYPLYQRPNYNALSAYSVFLEHAVEMGAAGLLAFLWLLATLGAQAQQQLARLRATWHPQGWWLMAALAGMAGLLAHGLVDTVWYRPQVNTLWWLLVALVASYAQPGTGKPRSQDG
jgi:putative inorganic carbon (HCO3(-)) transporter